jgi:hypothetical protein
MNSSSFATVIELEKTGGVKFVFGNHFKTVILKTRTT